MTEPKPIDLAVLQRSDLCGFWLRLKTLGYIRGTEQTVRYRRTGMPYIFIRTFWSFTAKDTPSHRVVFSLSAHGYSLQVFDGETEKCNVWRRALSQMEVPFLEYFKQTRPLQINRLGVQRPEVQVWLQAKALKAAKAEQARKAEVKKQAKANKAKASKVKIVKKGEP